jgi:hypothetical protein
MSEASCKFVKANSLAAKKGQDNESAGISKKDLRQVQGNSPPRRSARDLHQPKAQATPGIRVRDEF